MKEFADNDEIVIGAQSGSRKMLEACHRSHSVENVLAAVSLARKYGYKVIVDFIYGLPGESEADMKESMAVMEEVVRMGARIHPHVFAPLPQTAFAKEQPGSNLRRREGSHGTVRIPPRHLLCQGAKSR